MNPSNNNQSMIELRGVTKDFQQGSQTIHALKETHFQAGRGEFIAVIGPSGSGKSTFLTIIGGLQTPTSGEVFLAGENITTANTKARSAARFRNLGFVTQSSSLVPFLTVREQLQLHGKVTKDRADNERILAMLDQLGVADLADKYPADLSGGERQRVAIAAALFHQPSVVLADEPTAALDTERALATAELLRDLAHETQAAIVMVTHDTRLIPYCDRVYEIRDGELSEATA
ncbi:ABC transporter ATP-binding protein [Trueperella sp. LYQ143]|uniref:ABC transporter ATP-binding protein n=1 Tax=unclassified Trueperella TaxID=2630174 RepID=UPI003983416B